MPIKLEDATTRIFQGLKTSADKIYIVEARKRVSGNVVIFSPMKEWEYVLEPDLLHSLVKGGDSHAYHLSTTERLILFPYKDGVLIPQAVLQKQYPFTWNYLCENKKYLEEREDGMLKGENWYAFGRTQALDVISLPKIFICLLYTSDAADE